MKSKPARSARLAASAKRSMDAVLEARGAIVEELQDLVFLQGWRHLPARIGGNGGRRYDRPGILVGLERSAAFPRPLVGGLAAGMRKLRAELRTGAGDALGRIQRSPGRGFVVVGIKAEAAMRNAAAPLDIRHLDSDHAGAGHGQVHPVIEVPVAGGAVIRRILAHWRDGAPLRECPDP
jgi:hypothetical protein